MNAILLKYNIIFLFFFFLFLSLIYLNYNFLVYIFLVFLFIFTKYTQKSYISIFVTLIIIFSIFQFSSFKAYGTKLLFFLILYNLLFYLPFYYGIYYIFKKKLNLFLIPFYYYLIYFIFQFLILSNFLFNFTAILSIYPISISWWGSNFTLFLIILFNLTLFIIIDKICINKSFNFSLNKLINKSYRSNLYKSIFTISLFIILIINFFFLNFIFQDNKLFSKDKFNNSIGVLGIQGNIDQTWLERYENYEENFKHYKNLSLNGIFKHDVDILIWPEYTFTNPIEFNYNLLNKLNNFSLDNNLTLIIGSIKLENSSFYKSKRYNTLYIFDNGYLTYYNAYEPLRIFDPMVIKADSNTHPSSKNINLALALCYEENFANIYRKNVIKNNASILFTIGNQYYLKKYNALKLSSLNSNLRAIENNRYLFRLETAGLSTIIDNHGNNIVEIPINQEGILFYEIPLVHEKSFYSKYGFHIDFILFIFSFIYLLFKFIIELLNKKIKE